MKRARLFQMAHAALMGAPTFQYTTFDPAKKSASVTLSGGNLTASGSNAIHALSVIGKSTGKWYWEFAPNVVFESIGIATADGSYDNYVGDAVSEWGYRGSSNSIMNGNSFIQTGLASYTGGDIISVALDMDSLQVTWRKNNVVQGVAQSIAAGTWYAAAGGVVSGGAWSCTANFGASAFTYTPPAGFNAGLYL